MIMHRVCTLGHSTRDFNEVLKMLRNNNVTCLVDVRRFPSSRKFPQWAQSAIVEALPEDIEYQWIPQLGGRRHTPKGQPSLNGGWRVRAFRDYADYMAAEAFKEGLKELLELAEHKWPAIMCSEAMARGLRRRNARVMPRRATVELLKEEGAIMLAGRARMHRARHHWDASG